MVEPVKTMVTCSTYFTGNGLSLFLTDWHCYNPFPVKNNERSTAGVLPADPLPTDAEGLVTWVKDGFFTLDPGLIMLLEILMEY